MVSCMSWSGKSNQGGQENNDNCQLLLALLYDMGLAGKRHLLNGPVDGAATQQKLLVEWRYKT